MYSRLDNDSVITYIYNNISLFNKREKLTCEEISDGMKNESKWICCPQCGSKTRVKVYEETVLIKFPLYCQKCKKEYWVNVVKLKMVLSDEPDT